MDGYIDNGGQGTFTSQQTIGHVYVLAQNWAFLLLKRYPFPRWRRSPPPVSTRSSLNSYILFPRSCRLCCLCGLAIPPNPANMCVNCVRSQVDITEGIPRNGHIIYCSDCGRYLQPPRSWTRAELESKELLSLCLKKIKGLSDVKLVDASFVWTEPHSKRIKVKVTVQKEVFNGVLLQQSAIIEFVVEWQMCLDCNRANTTLTVWKANIQLRQHVEHKRTFLYLEQAILKHQADKDAVSIRNVHEGLDFFFKNRSHAVRLIDFMQGFVPIRFEHAKQLVSHDTHTCEYNYKYTFSVEIAPICKDDFVCLPAKLSAALGGFGPLCLVTRVTSGITLTCFRTLTQHVISGPQYWQWEFKNVLGHRHLVEYIVLDIELVHQTHSVENQARERGSYRRFALADATVARVADFGINDTVFHLRTHLGNQIFPGDHALGYDLSVTVATSVALDEAVAKGLELPDVILVRKSYRSKRARRAQRRNWELKRLEMEMGDDEVVPTAKGRRGKRGERGGGGGGGGGG